MARLLSVPLLAASCLPFCLLWTVLSRSVTSNCSPPGSPVHGDSPDKNTGVGCHALFQGIFPTRGPHPGLPPCRRMLYHQSQQGSPLFSELHYCPKSPFGDGCPHGGASRFRTQNARHLAVGGTDSPKGVGTFVFTTCEASVGWHRSSLLTGQTVPGGGTVRGVVGLLAASWPLPSRFGLIPTHPRAVTTPDTTRLCQMPLWRGTALSPIQNR